MAKPGYQGLTRIIKAAGYSAKGFRAAWKYESAFRQEVVLTATLIPLAFLLGRSAVRSRERFRISGGLCGLDTDTGVVGFGCHGSIWISHWMCCGCETLLD